MKRVSVAAGPVVMIKVRILPHAASPGEEQGMARTGQRVLYHLQQRDRWVICTGQVIQSRGHTWSSRMWCLHQCSSFDFLLVYLTPQYVLWS